MRAVTNWKFTDSTNTVAMRTLDSGMIESCLVSELADWISGGNTIDQFIEVMTVPQSVTPLQARRALRQAGLLDQVNAAAASTPETKEAWEFARSVERNSVFVATLAAALGLTDSQVDELFRLAETFTD